jgi:DNA-binding transcriptional MerR regulator
VKPRRAPFTVGEVAALTGLTIRTLHHYDRIRLVQPHARSRAGYRLYRHDDLERLQQVMFFRELGFPLKDIRRIMTASSFETRTALAAQRALLVRKADGIRALVAAIDRTLASRAAGHSAPSEKEMFEMFEKSDPKQYEDEARKRWGHTAAYAEAGRRTKAYGKAQWEAIKAEAEEITRLFSASLDRGISCDDQSVLDLAERHRQHIDRWFYPCSPEMHANLGRMYAADERFAANYETVRPGLAAYVRDAIVENARRLADPAGR